MTETKSKRDPVSTKRCEHGDDGVPCPNMARQYHRGRPICVKHVTRLARNGSVGGGGSNLLGRRVRKPHDVNDANRKRENAERNAGRRLAQVAKATGWSKRLVVFHARSGHGRKIHSADGGARISRMLLTSWVSRGWVVRELEHLRLTPEGAAVVAIWK